MQDSPFSICLRNDIPIFPDLHFSFEKCRMNNSARGARFMIHILGGKSGSYKTRP